jgi:hypothetical protein
VIGNDYTTRNVRAAKFSSVGEAALAAELLGRAVCFVEDPLLPITNLPARISVADSIGEMLPDGCAQVRRRPPVPVEKIRFTPSESGRSELKRARTPSMIIVRLRIAVISALWQIFEMVEGTKSTAASIFLSHTHADKPFVSRLARDLRALGARVWVDEAEIKLGDSLIKKIRDGIDETDFVGVVLSNNSVKSSWVEREVDIAMNQEIGGQRVKVLPLLIEDCPLPSFIPGKLYADFRKPDQYFGSLRLILDRLGISAPPPDDTFEVAAIEDVLQRATRLREIAASLKALHEDKRAMEYLAWAAATAREISEKKERQRTLSDIAEDMGALGMSRQALDIVHEFPQGDQLIPLRFVLQALAKAGRIDEAKQNVSDIDDIGHRGIVLATIASELAKRGRFDEALNVARGLSHFDAIFPVVEQFIRFGRHSEAEAAALMADRGEERAKCFFAIANQYIEMGDHDGVRRLMPNILTAAKMDIFDEDRHSIYWQLATLAETVGDIPGALKHLQASKEACFGFDKHDEGMESLNYVEKRIRNLKIKHNIG